MPRPSVLVLKVRAPNHTHITKAASVSTSYRFQIFTMSVPQYIFRSAYIIHGSALLWDSVYSSSFQRKKYSCQKYIPAAMGPGPKWKYERQRKATIIEQRVVWFTVLFNNVFSVYYGWLHSTYWSCGSTNSASDSFVEDQVLFFSSYNIFLYYVKLDERNYFQVHNEGFPNVYFHFLTIFLNWLHYRFLWNSYL